MILKNLADNSTLLLPDDLLWVDEHAWTPVVTSTSYLVTGALLVQSAIRKKGRPITLAAPSDMAWMTRAKVNRLYEWASLSSGSFEIQLKDARLFTVAFRHADGPLEAEAVKGFTSFEDEDLYRVTARLMEI